MFLRQTSHVKPYCADEARAGNHDFLGEYKKMEVASEMYDAIKEGGSTRILGHLMRVLASSYFFAFSHFRKVSTTNVFL